MVLLDDIKNELLAYRDDIKELYEVFAVEENKNKISELGKQTESPDFWNDSDNSAKVLKEIKVLENKIAEWKSLNDKLEDVITLIELSEEEGDESTFDEIIAEKNSFKKKLESTKLSTLLSGEYDGCNAILGVHSGSGGTEADDWALMLYRMYSRFCANHNFKFTLLDMQDGETAGIKSASVLVEGDNAYGYLKSEAGVHRLIRISPFDSGGRRHTSFAAVEVMPEIDDKIVIDIRPEDLKVDTYRSSGAGGQHINKTESAVRLTHIPSGVVVACQTQRSQHQNKDYAMKMLKSKLIEIKEREHLDKVSDIKGAQTQISWGAQIRTYTFMPYTLVKDHRSGFENGNVNAVMDGELDGFVNEYLKGLV
ncbi:MAG: peptide chain release factor 2 [Ruminococcus sp.]|jgi:peptide chain release factor 2|nr:peptide chain release factor 2 [Ruminococcus sp.]